MHVRQQHRTYRTSEHLHRNIYVSYTRHIGHPHILNKPGYHTAEPSGNILHRGLGALRHLHPEMPLEPKKTTGRNVTVDDWRQIWIHRNYVIRREMLRMRTTDS